MWCTFSNAVSYFTKNLLSKINITWPIYWKVIIDNSIYNSKTVWYCLMWDLFILDQINNQQTTQKCSLNLTVWALVLICYDPFLESKNHEIQFIFNLISICIILNKQDAQVDEAKKLTSPQVQKSYRLIMTYSAYSIFLIMDFISYFSLNYKNK